MRIKKLEGLMKKYNICEELNEKQNVKEEIEEEKETVETKEEVKENNVPQQQEVNEAVKQFMSFDFNNPNPTNFFSFGNDKQNEIKSSEEKKEQQKETVETKEEVNDAVKQFMSFDINNPNQQNLFGKQTLPPFVPEPSKEPLEEKKEEQKQTDEDEEKNKKQQEYLEKVKQFMEFDFNATKK